MNKLHFALAAASLCLAIAPAQADVPNLPGPALGKIQPASNSTTYVGAYSLTNGYSNRTVIGNSTNVYAGRFGIHTDVAHVKRSVSATYGELGLSYVIPQTIRVKGAYGASSGSESILPKSAVSVSLDYVGYPGVEFGPAFTVRNYRNGERESIGSLRMNSNIKFPKDTGGYWNIANTVSIHTLRSGRDTGLSARTALNTYRNNGMRFGYDLVAGQLSSDPITGTGFIGGRSKFLGAGLVVGQRFAKKFDLFVRGDYHWTPFYTAKGATAGLTINF